MKYILTLLLVCGLSIWMPQSNAQIVNLTAKNQGYYVVSANGIDISQHTQEREAIESAVNHKLANPAAAVQYRHDYIVTVEATAIAPSTGKVTLYWDPPQEAEVDGYRVFYSLLSGVYSGGINVGNVVTYTVQGLEPGKTYYFVVTAFKGEISSKYSNEVSKGL